MSGFPHAYGNGPSFIQLPFIYDFP